MEKVGFAMIEAIDLTSHHQDWHPHECEESNFFLLMWCFLHSLPLVHSCEEVL